MKLFILPSCPYCIRVTDWLQGRDIEGLEIITVPGPHFMRSSVKEATGQTYVPSLVDGDTVIADDDQRIIEYLADKVK